jgi:hypothetical protein
MHVQDEAGRVRKIKNYSRGYYEHWGTIDALF